METKPILFGLVGLILGGLIGVAAISFLNPSGQPATGEVLMSEMTSSLNEKKGDEYDKMFIQHMIEHHQAAVDMSRLSAANAKHDEIKRLSSEIIAAQEKEIAQMKQWQKDWGYDAGTGHGGMKH